MDPLPKLSADAIDALVADMHNRVRATFNAMPVYGIAGWRGVIMPGEWSWDEDPHSLAHGDPTAEGAVVQVQTRHCPPREGATALRLSATFATPAHSGADAFQSRIEQFGSPPDRVTDITVETTPVVFEVWDDIGGSDAAGTSGGVGTAGAAGEHWIAAGSYLDHTIVMEGTQVAIDSLCLVRVDDIEPYLAGQRAWLVARRGVPQ
jgi:hypothetical protein